MLENPGGGRINSHTLDLYDPFKVTMHAPGVFPEHRLSHDPPFRLFIPTAGDCITTPAGLSEFWSW
jgi:hypothetical protein